MAIYRFQYKGVTERDLNSKLPRGTVVTVSLTNPVVTVDVELRDPIPRDADQDLIEAMGELGWVFLAVV